MNLVIIISAIVVIFLLYILWKYFSSPSTTILSTSTSLLTANPDYQMTSNPASLRYALGMWIFVNSWSNTTNKYLCSIPGMMSVYLDSSTPTLYVDVASPNGTTTIMVTDNFPLQRWTYFTISCDVTYVDLYIDGKMIKSILLPNTPNAPSNTASVIYIGKDIMNSPSLNDIMLSNFIRWTNPLSPQDVWNQYFRGNGGSWLTGNNHYGMNIDLTNNNSIAATLKVV